MPWARRASARACSSTCAQSLLSSCSRPFCPPRASWSFWESLKTSCSTALWACVLVAWSCWSLWSIAPRSALPALENSRSLACSSSQRWRSGASSSAWACNARSLASSASRSAASAPSLPSSCLSSRASPWPRSSPRRRSSSSAGALAATCPARRWTLAAHSSRLSTQPSTLARSSAMSVRCASRATRSSASSPAPSGLCASAAKSTMPQSVSKPTVSQTTRGLPASSSGGASTRSTRKRTFGGKRISASLGRSLKACTEAGA
mmetsp:Transcript_94415/g.293645  ORF Transcript_94415/g.293645 Transcript_94415/m.293645 type:complete len:263 (-) Transcript_94415:757-1545(-)